VSRQPKSLKIALVGTGNVAWHLGMAFTGNGVRITQVIGRTAETALKLAGELDALGTDNVLDLHEDTDVCFLCVSDDALPKVLDTSFPAGCTLVHTAGSVPMNLLHGHAACFGVFYPLQTLTRGVQVDFATIPLLVEGDSIETLHNIKELAAIISNRVYAVDSGERLFLHLAAVFASNFTNHMYVLAEKLLNENGQSFDLLKPLVEETTRKAMGMSPLLAQTGPAVRSNTVVIGKHLEILADHPDMQEIYRIISENIRGLDRH